MAFNEKKVFLVADKKYRWRKNNSYTTDGPLSISGVPLSDTDGQLSATGVQIVLPHSQT